jgi:signal transduction histidine kinase
VLPTPDTPVPGSFVHAPIGVDERPVGVLSAYLAAGRVYFSPELLQFFLTLAGELGLGLRNAEHYRALDDLSHELEGKVHQRTAELERANRRLQELDRLKSDFVATVSHELRTPLTSIRSLSESLRDGLDGASVPPDVQHQVLDIIVQESQRLSRMINQVLDLSKIEAGQMEWDLAPVDLREVVAHAVDTNRALFDEKRIDLSVQAETLPTIVVADRDRIIQVVTNLLSNAAKFTPSGGRVEVRTAAEGNVGAVEVRDSGVGIAPDEIEAVFEKFRQVGDTLTAKPHGTGLGLPISREIVQRLGGSLTAQAQPGHGSSFRMALPLATDQPEQAGPPDLTRLPPVSVSRTAERHAHAEM